jgi:DNA-3-methyladenine glycosylase
MERINNKFLKRDFFCNQTIKVAYNLIGKYFVRVVDKNKIVGLIVETEFYGNEFDLASHARFKKSSRNKIMFGQAGFLYVYKIYGIHCLTNIITGHVGDAGAVLIRSAEIIDGIKLVEPNISNNKFLKANSKLATGPGKFSSAFGIDTKFNNHDLINSKKFQIQDSGRKIKKSDIIKSKRIGINYALDSKDYLWRFYLKNNQFVSRY